MSFWGEYGGYDDIRFLRDAEANKRRDDFIKYKMSRRQNKPKSKRRSKR